MPLFESAGRKFSFGDYKGKTVFSRVEREPDEPNSLLVYDAIGARKRDDGQVTSALD